MDLRLTEEHKMIRKMTRQFAEKEVAPIAAEMDEKAEVPFENIKKMGELGFLGLNVSEKYGGAGMDTVSYCIAIEEVSKACAGTGVVMAVQNSLVCYGIERFGTEEQKQRFLVPLAQGKFIGTFALTEPEAGSDAAAQKTTMVLDGDEYIVNGTKNFITSGSFADLILLFGMTDKSQGHRGTSALLVEKDTPGFSVGKEENKLGIRASNTCELVFEDCRVPVVNRLGEEGQGFKIAMSNLDAGRIGIAAQALGIAEVAYEASRLLIYNAALAKDRADETGARYSKEAAMAKLYASETASWVTDLAIQIHGGYGYVKEYPVERYYRDARITRIYEGTSEVQRIVIAGQILR
jgi:butyryl-CoA dehydrogenase